MFRKAMIVVIVALLVASAVLQLLEEDDEGPTAAEAKVAALSWVGGGEAQPPRREKDNWEVDVRRPDGSIVQVTIGDELQLRGIDEELGPAGTPAPDELRGRARDRAVHAAFWHIGPGTVVGVERDPNREIEVGVRVGKDQIEVRLDRRFRVIEVQPEDPQDE
ncbi:MAG TPA: hypothetical protein VG126_17090 [Thermoleophilaceae bacterium]|nr:hypothetical protein [Thermoleophilaceae bacterium]